MIQLGGLSQKNKYGNPFVPLETLFNKNFSGDVFRLSFFTQPHRILGKVFIFARNFCLCNDTFRKRFNWKNSLIKYLWCDIVCYQEEKQATVPKQIKAIIFVLSFFLALESLKIISWNCRNTSQSIFPTVQSSLKLNPFLPIS